MNLNEDTMKTYVYKLNLSSLHISSDPLSIKKPELMIHSDTLFSAVVNSYMELFGNAEDINEEFFLNPPFTVSSAFPYYKGTLFLKKPSLRLKISEKKRVNLRKKIKKAQFTSVDLFRHIISGDELEEEIFFEDVFMSNAPIDKRIMKTMEIPHSMISRRTNQSQIYYTTVVKFHRSAGLLFLARFRGEEAKYKFEAALMLLGDSGIGGDRTNGCGMFDFSVENLNADFENDGEYFVTLSLYHPTRNEIEKGILKNSHYNFVKRQNWIFSKKAQPIRSKSVRMFAEGSVFKNHLDVQGNAVNTTPTLLEEDNKLGHKIYRYGLLFKIPVSKEAVEAQDE